MLTRLSRLLTRSTREVDEAIGAADPPFVIYVMIPGDIQPLERGERFEDPLEGLLKAASLGTITGGGSQMDDPYPDGRPRVEYCGIDIDATDQDAARKLLRSALVKLGAPVGTELHFTTGDMPLLDRCDSGGWALNLKRDIRHPAFGV